MSRLYTQGTDPKGGTLSTVMQKKCEECLTLYNTINKAQRFCSQSCATKAVHKYNTKARVRDCENCGKTFLPRNQTIGRFCSNPCKWAASRGEKSPNWQGGKVVNSEGYVRIYKPEHPKADHYGYVSEHRFVMEESIGRPLESYETVHHINGVRGDNRLENLQLRTGNHGKGIVLRCIDCGSPNIESVALSPQFTAGG